MTIEQQKITFSELVKPLSVTAFWVTSILFSLVIQYLFVPSTFILNKSFFFYFFWVYTIYFTQSLGNSYLRNRFIDRYFSWEKTPMKKLLLLVIVTVVYAAVGYAMVATIFIKYQFSYSLAKSFHAATFGMKSSAIVAMIFAFIFATISFYINWQRSQLKAKKLETDLANYRYESLKKQVNPHFLFNSLNVLADLVHEDADLSEKYIHQLSKIYRYVLESAKRQTVPLMDEAQFIASYAFLLDIRFGKKVSINIDLHPAPNEFIIPVSLQTLVENAVKHNQATKQNPLKISITQNNHKIVVENNLQIKNKGVDSSGTGLENLKQQYALVSDESILIEQTDDCFRVTLPVLNSSS